MVTVMASALFLSNNIESVGAACEGLNKFCPVMLVTDTDDIDGGPLIGLDSNCAAFCGGILDFKVIAGWFLFGMDPHVNSVVIVGADERAGLFAALVDVFMDIDVGELVPVVGDFNKDDNNGEIPVCVGCCFCFV